MSACVCCVCPCCGVRNISQIMTQFCYQIGSNVISVSVERGRKTEMCAAGSTSSPVYDSYIFIKIADFGAQDGNERSLCHY